MAVYLCLGDPHASDRPPSSCTASYLGDILDLLRASVRIAVDRKCAGAVWAGDIFHSKVPGRTSHRTVQRLIEVGQSYPCPWFIVPGNHDLQGDNLDSVTDTQPLGVLFRSGAIRLEGWAEDHPLYGVPWQQDWERNLGGALEGFWSREIPRPFNELVIAHAPLYPPGQELPYENVPASLWATAMGNHGCVYYGHVHEAHGVFETGGVRFCNNGAISRGSLHEHNLLREVAVTLWDSETGSFERVPLPQKPASEVFRLAEAQREKASSRTLDDFLASIGSSDIAVLSIESILDHVSTMDLDPGDRILIEELIRGAQG